VQRNAFGSQIDSFETSSGRRIRQPVSATFIRAPRVVQTGPEVDVLAFAAGRRDRRRAPGRTARHRLSIPEMSETRFHQLLLDLIAARAS
jgi:5'-phosphate synthase pdxT subunit